MWFNDKEKPNHPIVKALINKGFKNFELNYSKSEFWCIEGEYEIMQSTKGWLGYTIKSAVKKIDNLKIEDKNEN